MATTKQTIERAYEAAAKHPVRYLVIISVLLIAGLVLAVGTITAVRYKLQDRKVDQLERKTEDALKQEDAAKAEADKAAQERAIEDAIRERTIKPEIQRTARNLEEARSRTRGAKADYEQSKKNNPGNNPDSRAQHERNCAELRELYPGEPIPLCEP